MPSMAHGGTSMPYSLQGPPLIQQPLPPPPPPMAAIREPLFPPYDPASASRTLPFQQSSPLRYASPRQRNSLDLGAHLDPLQQVMPPPPLPPAPEFFRRPVLGSPLASHSPARYEGRQQQQQQLNRRSLELSTPAAGDRTTYRSIRR